MARIFISYRRSDSLTATGRIYDRLVEAFGIDNVFKDVDALMIGVDFRSVINREIGSSDALLAIIGKNWLNAVDEEGKRRLDNPNDFVRLEIEFALRRRTMLVVPVLVGGAQMPNASDLPPSMHDFAFRHAAQVRDDPDFRADISRLIESITKFIIQNTPTAQVPLIAKPNFSPHDPPSPPLAAPKAKGMDETDVGVIVPKSFSVPDTDVLPRMPLIEPAEPAGEGNKRDATTASLTHEEIQRRINQDNRFRAQLSPNPPSKVREAAAQNESISNTAPLPSPSEPAKVIPIERNPSPGGMTPINSTPAEPSLTQNAGRGAIDMRLILIGIAILLVLTIIMTLLASRS